VGRALASDTLCCSSRAFTKASARSLSVRKRPSNRKFGEWLSLVEHLVRDQGVGGSNPLSPTITLIMNNLALVLTSKLRASGVRSLEKPASRINRLPSRVIPWANQGFARYICDAMKS
jgi:hypothetical protein